MGVRDLKSVYMTKPNSQLLQESSAVALVAGACQVSLRRVCRLQKWSVVLAGQQDRKPFLGNAHASTSPFEGQANEISIMGGSAG